MRENGVFGSRASSKTLGPRVKHGGDNGVEKIVSHLDRTK